jgi:methyltransferase (TIGR00027 family)
MILQTKSFSDTANMKAGRSNQEAPACRMAGLIEDGSIGEPVFGVKLAVLDRPSFGPYPLPMQQGRASVTAVGAAGHRAAHQVLERGLVFVDPLALRILGPDADDAIALAKERPERRGLRLFIAMRSRFAEDSARRAIEKGARQVLVLGAGLDTFAYRLEQTPDLRIFELDHPATQAEKRRRLSEAKIAEPAHVAYVAHDFEGGSMTAALEAASLDPARRTFVIWLGVTPYLAEQALFATLGELARFPGGAEVVFDYANPPHAIEEGVARDFHREMAERVAASGEPFRCYLDSAELHARARDLGFFDIEDLDRAALVARYLPDLAVAPRPGPGGHVVRMATG